LPQGYEKWKKARSKLGALKIAKTEYSKDDKRGKRVSEATDNANSELKKERCGGN